MRSFSSLGFLLFLAVLHIPASGKAAVLDADGNFTQDWKIYLEKIDPGNPCDSAEVEFQLLDGRNRPKATLTYPVPPETGMRILNWKVTLEDPGDYRLRARLQGCGKAASQKATFPVRVTPVGEERFVHLQLVNGPKALHISHFSVNRERIGNELFEISFSPPRIRNLTGRPLIPCRRNPIAPVEYFRRYGPEWRIGGLFGFPEGTEVLEPDRWIPLERKAVYMFMDWENPESIQEVVRINYREAGFFLYPDEPEGSEGEEPPPRFCDAYFLEIFGPENPSDETEAGE